MNTDALRDAYDQQLRGEAEAAQAAEVQRLGPLWLLTYPQQRRGMVTYASLPPAERIDGLIDEVTDFYRRDDAVDFFEWKTRSHDHPRDLDVRLQAHGFTVEEPETVMVGTVESAIAARPDLPPGYEVQRATNEEALRDATRLAGTVFGDTAERAEGHAEELLGRLCADPASLQMWLVRGPSGAVVCSGRIDFVDGTEFAGLWGGACDANHRGKGLYRALTAARAEAAAERDVKYLQSGCTAYSRPILEKAGMVAITQTTPALWHRNRADSSQ